jgi:NAD(P)-dependent dehydrogenase (short-subunit alcohol dehydrogenase family)
MKSRRNAAGHGGIVVVTGVSSGIGRAVASVLAGRGIHVFGSVRSEKDAAAFAADLGENATPLLFDITDAAAVAAAVRQVRARLQGRTLRGLVNNAGVAVFGPLMHVPLGEVRRQLEVNLLGPLLVTQSFLPLLGTDRSLAGAPGRIVNIGSIGGKIAPPFLGPYAASKFALEGLSESLRRELMLYGIDVIVIGPGAVATPIWGKAEHADTAAYQGTDYAEALRRYGQFMLKGGKEGFPPERIGETVWKALSAGRPRVRYAVVPRALTGWFMPRILPKRAVDRIFARSLGFSGTAAGSVRE